MNKVTGFNKAINRLDFMFNGQPGALYLNTQSFICDGYHIHTGKIDVIDINSEFAFFLKDTVLRSPLINTSWTEKDHL